MEVNETGKWDASALKVIYSILNFSYSFFGGNRRGEWKILTKSKASEAVASRPNLTVNLSFCLNFAKNEDCYIPQALKF